MPDSKSTGAPAGINSALTCVSCGSVYLVRHRGQKCCSAACAAAYARGFRRWVKKLYPCKCENCRNEYHVPKARVAASRFCSVACLNAWHRHANDSHGKAAAKKLGLTIDEYKACLAAGQKWCVYCRQWHDRSVFPSDRSRGDGLAPYCKESRCANKRRVHHANPGKRRRDPEKQEATRYVLWAVKLGVLPHPNTVPCADCGKSWVEGDSRHEHDHHEGYAEDKRLAVEPLCNQCHKLRELKRQREKRQ